MSFKSGLIIAGGFGTRMLPLTNYIPKSLIEVNKKPLIQHMIDFFKSHKIDTIIVTYGYKAPVLIEYINSEVNLLVNTINKDNAYFLFNTPIKFINEPIIVCPCDLIIDIDLQMLYKEYIQLQEPPLCIIPINANDNADFIHSENGIVTQITRDTPSNICASGIQIINPFKVNAFIKPYNNFYDVWKALIAKKLLFISKIQPQKWQAFDNLKDII